MAYGHVNVGSGRVDDSSYLKYEQIGVPGGLATLNEDGKLSESQRPDLELDVYTKSETDSLISTAVSSHNTSSGAHSDIRGAITSLQADVQSVELRYATNVTENSFKVTFANLEDVTVDGVWNVDEARVDF